MREREWRACATWTFGYPRVRTDINFELIIYSLRRIGQDFGLDAGKTQRHLGGWTFFVEFARAGCRCQRRFLHRRAASQSPGSHFTLRDPGLCDAAPSEQETASGERSRKIIG